VRVWGRKYREELILNITVFIVRVLGGHNTKELIRILMVSCEGVGILILNFIVFVVSFWGEQYRENLILHVTMLVVRV